MKLLLILTFGMIFVANSPGQGSRESKETVLPRKPVQSSFTCPDSAAAQSCKSYGELLRAGDRGLPSEGYVRSYVCFRKHIDEFFSVWFTPPDFRKHWDAESQEMVIDDSASSVGRGGTSSYKDGVEDYRVQPNLAFKGKWTLLGHSVVFASEKLLFVADNPGNDSVVSIDDRQFSIAKYQFKNSLGKTISYNLTIQLSTGRFSESFIEASKQVPFSQSAGYCIYAKSD